MLSTRVLFIGFVEDELYCVVTQMVFPFVELVVVFVGYIGKWLFTWSEEPTGLTVRHLPFFLLYFLW